MFLNKKSQSLIESVVAISIVVIAVIGAIIVAFVSILKMNIIITTIIALFGARFID